MSGNWFYDIEVSHIKVPNIEVSATLRSQTCLPMLGGGSGGGGRRFLVNFQREEGVHLIVGVVVRFG